MLILVSDLHLADHSLRASFDAATFLRELRTQLDQCPKGDTPRLILLGDVFDLLKTPRWHETALRPWREHSDELGTFVASIAQEIITTNPEFFLGLGKLRDQCGLQIELLPGNHDGLLANESGRKARAVFRHALGLAGADDPLLSVYLDTEHGTVAQHGHEFDDFNKPSRGRPRFVAGDVVVIELVAALPRLVARALSTREDDERLRFLHGLDNVLPQDGKGLVAWMQFGASRLAEPDRSLVLQTLKESLSTCLARAREEARTYGEMGAGLSGLLKAVGRFVASTGLPGAEQLVKLQPLAGSEFNAVHSRALAIASTQDRDTQQTFLFVAGHTHLPVHVPMPVGRGRVITYLNSGTWRRVYLCVDLESGGRSFATYNEESMLVVQRREGDHPPAYDFRRQVRGL